MNHMSQSDLIVVGAGTAGMMAAIFAAKRGKKVTVIEKSDHIGGSMHWSGGHMSGAGTKRQQALGIEDNPERHYQDIMRINGGTGDLSLIRKSVELAPAIIDWLQDEGFDFAPECPRIVYGHVPYEIPRTHYGTENAKSILKIILPHWQEEVKRGAILCLLEHEVVRLEQNAGHYDTVYTIHQGRELAFKGGQVLMTTGGYGSNPEFFKAHHPEIPLVSAAYPSSTGEGIQMVVKEGGVMLRQDHHLSSMGGIESPVGSGRCDFYEGWANVLTSVYRQPRDIYVDQNGHRFMTEDEINPDTRERIMLANDIWHFWIIFDEAALLEREESGIENPIVLGWNTEKIKKEAKEEKYLFAAPDLASLSEKIKIPTENLISTVSKFNDMIEQGKDPDFGRTYLENKIAVAPFYALKVHASVLVTFGGVQINDKMQVLNKNGQTLSGLHACGEIIGLGATSGTAFFSGQAITPCLSFGRWFGENIEL